MTSHDGFTLWDMVSYNHKHNEANGEDNRDGENHNRSFNFGIEGPTDDPIISHSVKSRCVIFCDLASGTRRSHAFGRRRESTYAARQ